MLQKDEIRIELTYSPFLMTQIALFLLFCFFANLSHAEEKSKKLNIYNWSDYIAPDTIKHFEQKTGIKVTYDTYSSNEELEKLLMTHSKNYDLVTPTSNFLERQLQSDIYLPLDKSKLPAFYTNFDPTMLNIVAEDDPDNTYAFPYMWTSTGLGFNVDMVEKALGGSMPIDSWALIFDKKNAEKLKDCGIVWLDAPAETFSLVLRYLGFDPNTHDSDAYFQATQLLESLKPYVRYVDSSAYIDDLAQGKICISMGWSGDVYQAAERAKSEGLGVNIDYVIPKEGTFASFDVMGIPKNADNIEEAYEFLNYLLQPEVIAEISNYVFYANPNTKALPYLDSALVDNPNIYPPKEKLQKLYALDAKSPRIERAIKRGWTDILATK